jgi:hypothetical protein
MLPASGLGRDSEGIVSGVEPDPRAGIEIGTSRANVLFRLGRPHAGVYRSSGRETLIFNDTTIVLQNGIVAVVH